MIAAYIIGIICGQILRKNLVPFLLIEVTQTLFIHLMLRIIIINVFGLINAGKQCVAMSLCGTNTADLIQIMDMHG